MVKALPLLLLLESSLFLLLLLLLSRWRQTNYEPGPFFGLCQRDVCCPPRGGGGGGGWRQCIENQLGLTHTAAAAAIPMEMSIPSHARTQTDRHQPYGNSFSVSCWRSLFKWKSPFSEAGASSTATATAPPPPPTFGSNKRRPPAHLECCPINISRLPKFDSVSFLPMPRLSSLCTTRRRQGQEREGGGGVAFVCCWSEAKKCLRSLLLALGERKNDVR